MATEDVKEFLGSDKPHFSRFIGLKITHVSPERVEATLEAREELSNRHGVLHGGAIMTIADTIGGVGTSANLPAGGGTVTIESKTNFFAGIPVGDTARAECTPLHRGRTTMVWQTKIMRSDGRLAALVTQTQLVIPPRAQ
ncbi:MAG TPA: PaaI family thioesterase [Xanthobacteraceae bacterium]|nr:PaaI family thioesterase [Xanthobacteraceae bacterium]